ncbi:MAG TPA: LPS export ABC transporter permease LptF [Gammaproteobacteria bacterium]|nr:LPS export ABC transporter permease LptF [Gammaproteobacteria bacterium]
MIVVLVIVLVISLGWRFSGYLDRAAAGVMTGEVLFALMAFRLPGFLEIIIPISFFLALMLTYGRLHVDHEMIVLQACGMSPTRIVFITLMISAIVMLLTSLVALWVKPMGERQVQVLLQEQKNLTEFDTLVPGRFQSLSSGRRVTYTEEINDKGELTEIFINEYLDPAVPSARASATVIATSGRTEVDIEGRRFLVLNNGQRYEGKPGDPGYQIIEYEEYGQLVEKDSSIFLDERNSAIPSLDLFERSDPAGLSELHWRLSVVLMIPVIGLLAIPLSRVNPRQGRFTRLVPAMILCFLYVIALSAGKSGIEREDFPAEYGLWWIHGVFLLITFVIWHLEKITKIVRY